MTASPLGRYAPMAAAAASLFVIVAAVLVHAFGKADTFLDYLAVLAFGTLIGVPLGAAQGRAEGTANAVQAINGALAQGHAANARLDAIGAPSAAAAVALSSPGAPAAQLPQVPVPLAPLQTDPAPAPGHPSDAQDRIAP